MNTIAHPQRIDGEFDFAQRLGRAASRAFPAVIALLVFALVFAASVALRLVTLAGTNPSVAAAVHGAFVALGLAD
jgi:hypothetical protein